MAKTRLTKNELKKQKEQLKRFNQYLPTLYLKKQQLQAEIHNILKAFEKETRALEKFNQEITSWVKLFAEETSIKEIIKFEKIEITTGNIAGIDVPIFRDIIFSVKEYDVRETPLWLDDGIEAIKTKITMKAKLYILEQQLKLVSEEVRITTQRVNLFEKVKIPEAKENIRKIRIFLGDLETAAVVTGKIAKAKLAKI
ncbi:V-type ATPase subunit D [Candidatus Omnitrophus magneticus]|uniref:V-type ATPase subunit D n=1 Tax=Candidatus Omnitrophus magneticus TaxID=1609969 RepID=A0A0F0CR64_9BACT|nr:V-type ATPase subunit D [Candidatus Omnitrophus magneticus]